MVVVVLTMISTSLPQLRDVLRPRAALQLDAPTLEELYPLQLQHQRRRHKRRQHVALLRPTG